MTSILNLHKEFTTSEMQRFLRRQAEQRGRDMKIYDVPLKNFVDVDSKLLETKVSTLFLQGATDEAGFWSDLINVVNMTSPVQEVPIISQRDIRIHKGKVPRAGVLQSGGKVRKVELDTKTDDKIRYVLLQIDEEDVKLRRFDYVERAIIAAGSKFARNILDDIVTHYVTKAGNSQALSTDKRFVAVMKAINLNKADGFGCSAIIFDNDDFVDAITEETAGGALPWLEMLVASGETALAGTSMAKGIGMRDGLVGSIFGRVPVFVVTGNTDLDGDIVCVDVPSAAALGFAPGGEIELSQELHQIRDLLENKIQAKYDINNPDDDGSGNSNAIAKVTGA